MGLFKNILKTAKEIYQADSNNELGNYVSSKVNKYVNKFDGTEEEEWEQQKNDSFEIIKENFLADDVDNDTFQQMLDDWKEKYSSSNNDDLIVFYYKAIGWDQEHDMLFDYRKDNYSNLSDEESEELDYLINRSNEEALTNISQAIECLDEEIMDLWLCCLYNAKAKCLHKMGKHLEAVRTAIIGLECAYDNDEKEEAKCHISAKLAPGSDYMIESYGYGIEKRTKEEKLALYMRDSSFEPDANLSFEENTEMLEFYCLATSCDVPSILNEDGTLSKIPYHDRQFIFTVRDLDHIGGCYDETDTVQYVFAIDELPKNISFPIGHPQPNTLYYAHPLRSVYLPFENAQILLFHERIQEICRLFQCLGATKITARCLKGEKVSESVITSNEFNVEGGYKIIDGSLAYSGKDRMLGNRENKNEMFLEQTFSPKKYPYCPDNLLWTLNDPEIQTFIHQRLEGGLLSFTKRVSSFETSSLSQNRINDVQGAFQNLIMKVSANYSASEDTTFNSIAETEWELNVQFKPMEEFDITTMQQDKIKLPSKDNILMSVTNYCPIRNEDASNVGIVGTLMKNVKKYDKVLVGDEKSVFESEVTDVIVSFKSVGRGEAGSESVILLLKGVTLTNIRSGMNIYLCDMNGSSSQQISLDTTIKTNDIVLLTANEEKYKEEALFCIEDGGCISTDDRKYLERKRLKWGISEERAFEIESQCISTFTADEIEYVETFKEMCQNGEISERIRRLLERERESLGISKSRADELEKLALNSGEHEI